jgi:RNA polymerase sigma factor (sigma-70 family)
MTEQELLSQYVETRNPDAFHRLVEQHENMVFAVCRRMLGNEADAQDASQECFLEMVRCAPKLKSPIGGWLHRVAVRVSIDLLRQKGARRRREWRVAQEQDDAAPPTWDGLKEAVDEAITSLPEDLRVPVVLYYLEEQKQEQIAQDTGLSVSAVSRRLTRAEEALRKRLTKAGWTGTGALAVALLAEHGVEAAPAALKAALGKMALAGSAAQSVSAAGSTSSGSASGASSILKYVAAGALAAAMVILVLPVMRRNPPVANPAPPPVSTTPAAMEAREPQAQLSGRVLLPDGRPALGAVIKLYYLHDPLLPPTLPVLSEAKADDEGVFHIANPDFRPPEAFRLEWSQAGRYLIAAHPDHAIGFVPALPDQAEGYTIWLADGTNVACRVVDAEGTPVANARVTVRAPNKAMAQPATFMAWMFPRDIITQAEYAVTTDDDGRAAIAQAPSPGLMAVKHGIGYGEASLPAGAQEVTIQLKPGVILRGQVTAADTNAPLARILVTAQNNWMAAVAYTRTDPNGRYEFWVPMKDRDLTLGTHDVNADPVYADAMTRIVLNGEQERTVDFAMERGRKLSGRLLDEKSGKPLAGVTVNVVHHRPGQAQVLRRVSDEQGRWSFCLTPARTQLSVQRAHGGGEYATEYIDEFPLDKDQEIEHRTSILPVPRRRLRVVDGEGRPVAGAELRVVQLVSAMRGVTDRNGEAEIVGFFLPGFWQPNRADLHVHVTSPDSRDAAYVVLPLADNRPAEIVLRTTREVEVVLLDERGQQLAGWAYLGLLLDVLKPHGYQLSDMARIPDQEGAFVVRYNLLPGVDYRLHAKAAGAQRREWVKKDIRIPANGPVSRVAFAFADPVNESAAQTGPRTQEDFQGRVAALGQTRWKREDTVDPHLTWYATAKGVAVINADTKEIRQLQDVFDTKSFQTTAIAFGVNKVWIGTDQGLIAWDRKGGFWSRFAVGGELLQIKVLALSMSKAGTLNVTVEQDGQPREHQYDENIGAWRDSTGAKR